MTFFSSLWRPCRVVSVKRRLIFDDTLAIGYVSRKEHKKKLCTAVLKSIKLIGAFVL